MKAVTLVTFRRFLRLTAHLQMLPVFENGPEGGEETLIGGQAVMEGVMMLAPHSCCIAVRNPQGEIVTHEHPVTKIAERYPIFKYPIFRGLGRIGQTMALGAKATKFSFNTALGPELSTSKNADGKKSDEISSNMLTLGFAVAFLIFIFLFKFAPLYMATRLGHAVPALSSRFAVNMADGLIRIGILLVYLFVLSRLKDMRRIFQYHGAEHKVVFNYESGKPVSVAKRAAVHDVSSPLRHLLPAGDAGDRDVRERVAADRRLRCRSWCMRIALLPLVIGLSYELIRFAAKRQGTLMGMLTRPGLWLQRITTKQPDDGQAAVAVHALNGAMELEAKQGGTLVVA